MIQLNILHVCSSQFLCSLYCVPQEYQYDSTEQAAEIITRILTHFSEAEQTRIKNDINKFSNFHYITGFKTILNEI